MSDKLVYRGLGRRKSSTARIFLKPTTNETPKFMINKRIGEDYLMSDFLVKDIFQPLILTKNEKAFDINVNVRGGGLAGQAGAIRLGIAKALINLSKDYKPILKKHKMLTRDSRIKERKKPGLRKARKSRQFSKR